MAIYLVTGNPGAGKTSFSLSEAERKSNGNRKIYHSGNEEINHSSISKMEDPTKWFDLESNSILIFEDGKLFKQLSKSEKNLPNPEVNFDWIEELQSPANENFDIYITADRPSLIDKDIYPLVKLHYHLVRASAPKLATIHLFEGVNHDVDKNTKGSFERELVFSPR